MRDYLSYEELSDRAKRSLQLCHEGISRGKYLKEEYQLFNELADLYLLKGDIREYPKVIAIYQYLHKLVGKAYANDKEKEDKLAELERNVGLVEAEFIEKITGKKVSSGYGIRSFARVKEYKRLLEEYRGIEETENYDQSIRARLKGIESFGTIEGQEELDEEGLLKRSQAVEAIYNDIREFFIGKREKETGELKEEKKGIINELIEDCIEELGGLPQLTRGKETRSCEYAIFGMGSMALGTMTPWSDIEFGILIEDGLSETEEKNVKKYFRNLTTLLHIKVVNFGETPLRMMGIEELNNFRIGNPIDDWFYDDLINPGFSFDGPHSHACKTPLGRKGYKNHKVFELICTPTELLKFQDKNWYKTDLQLSQTLVQVALISGSATLVKAYQNSLKESHDLITEQALEILRKDVITYDAHISDQEEEGKLYNVKKEIYRLPDRMLAGLACYYGIKFENIYYLIREIYTNDNNKLTNEQRVIATTRLEITVSIAIELRLRIYQANHGQKEIMAISTPTLQSNNSQLQEVFQIPNLKILFRFYYTALPLHAVVSEFCNSTEIVRDKELGVNYLRERVFFDNSSKNTGLICKRLLQYEAAEEKLREYYNEHLNDHYISNILGNVYCSLSKFTEAEKCYQSIISHGEENQYYNKARFNLANVFLRRGVYKEAKEICINLLKMNNLSIVDRINTFMNYSLILRECANYKAAKKCYKQIESILIANSELFKNQSTIFQAFLHQNKGLILLDLGEYRAANNEFEKCLRIKEKLYGSNHPEIASILINIGLIYMNQAKYHKAKEYYDVATTILDPENNNKPSYALIELLLSYGDLYSEQMDEKEALAYYRRAISLLEQIGLHISAKPGLYCNLIPTYIHLGLFDEAEKTIVRLETINGLSPKTKIALPMHRATLLYYQGKYPDKQKQYIYMNLGNWHIKSITLLNIQISLK